MKSDEQKQMKSSWLTHPITRILLQEIEEQRDNYLALAMTEAKKTGDTNKMVSALIYAGCYNEITNTMKG